MGHRISIEIFTRSNIISLLKILKSVIHEISIQSFIYSSIISLFKFYTCFVCICDLFAPQVNYNKEAEYMEKYFWNIRIIGIIFLWIEFLYTLRKSPLGIYILMMHEIMKSFGKIFLIWGSTLLCFASIFQLIMRDYKENLKSSEEKMEKFNETIWAEVGNL